MPVYINTNGALSELKEDPIKLERDIQRVFETNLKTLTGLTLVKSEFTIKNRRIDTLAYDEQSKAFIIIEYKRERNISVFDQGITYLNLMLENKADFIIEYNENAIGVLKRDEVDWSQSRVVFVSTSFTDNQRQAVNFKDFGIELWEIKNFERNVVQINYLKKTASAPSIKDISGKTAVLKNVNDEIKDYSEEYHLERGSEYTAELYEKFKTAILQLSPELEIKGKKFRVSFHKGAKIISDITIAKRALKIWINLKKGSLDDPKGLAKDVSNIGHWGVGDYEIQVENDRDLEYIMSLIKQSIYF
jgi:predicted transport protein